MQNPIFRQAALDRLSSPEQLDQLIQITTPRGWLALAAMSCVLITFLALGFVMTVPQTVQGQCTLVTSPQGIGKLEALLYVSPTEANQLGRGEEVHILPLRAKSEPGFVLGHVQDTLATLSDQELAQAAAAGEFAAAAVRVELELDPKTGDYLWSFPRGSAVRLSSGTPCKAETVIHPIELVLPRP